MTNARTQTIGADSKKSTVRIFFSTSLNLFLPRFLTLSRLCFLFTGRQHRSMQNRVLASVRLSVRLSVTRLYCV